MTLSPQTTVDKLFGQKIRFRVPSYQRAYSWQADAGANDQVGQFLRDIQEQNPATWYSLGHFLFGAGNGYDVLEVIDGQQRLTTVVIFMSCLVSECRRREMVALGDIDVDEIAETYLRHRVQKFQTVEEDAAYFRNRIVQGDASAVRLSERRSERNLDEAACYFAEAMARASVDELCEWYCVISSAVVTTFVIEGPDAKQIAAQIFSYQNDRGKDLTTLEKVKAYLMSQVYRHAPSEAEDYIGAVEKSLASIYAKTEVCSESEDTILRWHCQAYIGCGSGAFEAIRDGLTRAEDKIAWIVTFSAQLAKTFDIVVGLESVAERYSGYVADICYLDKACAMPLMIKLAQYGKLAKNDARDKALEYVEHILFKLTFTTGGFRTNNLVALAREFDGENYDSWLLPNLRDAAEHGFQWYWDFNGCCLRYFTENRYHYVRELKYVLYKYENHLRDQHGDARLDIGACVGIFRENKSVENTLDHIAPQHPDYTLYTDVFQGDYLSNLGNLSLLSWSGNAAKSNHDPTRPEERKRYDTVCWSQTEIYETLCKGQWGEKEIDERRERIVSFIKKNWGL